MTPRRLPLATHTLRFPRVEPAPVAWTRKAIAMTMHLTGLALFALFVVWPVAGPMASGELAREFKPLLDALAAMNKLPGSGR